MGIGKLMKPTKQDGILAASVLAAALLSLGLFWLLRPSGDVPLVAVVTVDTDEFCRLPLDTDATVSLPTGHVVVVKDRKVSVTSAPCPDQICVNTSAVGAVGGSIVCLPERVIITVTEAADE